VNWSSHSLYWLQQTGADVPPADDWLSAAEAARLARFHIPKRRADWRLGRWTAKQALSAYLNQPAANFEIRAAPDGAPEAFLHGRPAGVNISISHSAGVAICAIAATGVALGCDIEQIEPRSPAFLEDYFTTEEQYAVAATPAAAQALLVTLLWSAKESVLKALREGLRLDPRTVHISATGESEGTFSARCSDSRIFEGCWDRTGDLIRAFASDPLLARRALL